MPTYEKRADDGTVLERTVTLPAGHPSGYDEQMAALAAADNIPWHLVEDVPIDDHRVVTALATGQFPATSAAAPPAVHYDLKTEEV